MDVISHPTPVTHALAATSDAQAKAQGWGHVWIVQTLKPCLLPTARVKLWKKWRVFAYLFLGLICFELIARISQPLWRVYSPDDYELRLAACQVKPTELLIIGGSPVAEGFIPEHFQCQPYHTVFNLGLSGGTTTDFYYALNHAVKVPPKLLVYGITATDLNDNRNEPNGVQTFYSKADVEECAKIRPDVAEWVQRKYRERFQLNLSKVYRHRNGIRLATTDAINTLMPQFSPKGHAEVQESLESARAIEDRNGYSPAKGFVHRSYAYGKSVGEPGAPFGFLDRYRFGSHVKYVDKILEWSQANGCEIILVDMPYTEDLEVKYAAELKVYQTYLAELERTRKVRVIRASRTEVGLTDAHFADMIHLNNQGATLLSRWVAKEIHAVVPR